MDNPTNRDELYPKETKEDKLYQALKSVAKSPPVIGGVLGSFIDQILKPPIEKRREKWFNNLFLKLQEIEEQLEDFKVENLVNNESFISIQLKLLPKIMVEHKEEKLKRFTNILLKSAINPEIYDEFDLFMQYIDDFTELHIELLKFFFKPIFYVLESPQIKWFYRRHREADPSFESHRRGNNPNKISHYDMLKAVFPSKEGSLFLKDGINVWGPNEVHDQDVIFKLIADLINSGFVRDFGEEVHKEFQRGRNDRNIMPFDQRIKYPHYLPQVFTSDSKLKLTTNLGDRFLDFIGEPILIREIK